MPGHGTDSGRRYVEGRLEEAPDRTRAPWYVHAVAILASAGVGLGGWGVTRSPSSVEVARPVNACAAQAEANARNIRRLERQLWRLQDSALVRLSSSEWAARERRAKEGRPADSTTPALPRF